MPGVIDYLIPTDSMTLSAQANLRQRAIKALMERAISKNIGSQQDWAKVLNNERPDSIEVREFQCLLDAGTALDQWNTAALAAVGTAVSVFQAIAAPQLANNRIAVFYKVSVPTIPNPVSRLIFRIGGAAGNQIGVFDLEQLDVQDRVDGYFSEPVVIDYSTTFAIQALPRVATGVLARVILGTFVVEPAGTLLTSVG